MSDLFSEIARQKEIEVLKTFCLEKTVYHDRYTEAREFERFYTKTYISEKYPDYRIEMFNEPWGIDRNPPEFKLYQNDVLIHIEYRKQANIYKIAQIILGVKNGQYSGNL